MKNNEKFVITLDQGTTSSRSCLVNKLGHIVAQQQQEYPILYPSPGWVEQDPCDILNTQVETLKALIKNQSLDKENIDCIGITNQRETTIIWDRKTGKPVYNAIVWQCRRSVEIIDKLCGGSSISQLITKKTGLIPDAYFSASKIRWILDNVKGLQARAEAGELCFGTVDSWLIYNLTGKNAHVTDETNASRTMLFNIHEGRWDSFLLDLFNIPECMLPKVMRSASLFGTTKMEGLPKDIAICGVAGDQQSALFGQCCFEPGQVKNTYGTGCFMLMNTGAEAILSKKQLVTTIAACAPSQKERQYALEGSVFMGGALIQWLRDELKIIDSAKETEELASSIDNCSGVTIVPAFTGLGAPYWRSDARGTIFGLTRGAGRPQIVRAALEAIAYQVSDLLKACSDDAGFTITSLNVDGGASANKFLMQFQADILQCEINRPENIETTALGAAYLAGLYSGFWKNTNEILSLCNKTTVFSPQQNTEYSQVHLRNWQNAVASTFYRANLEN